MFKIDPNLKIILNYHFNKALKFELLTNIQPDSLVIEEIQNNQVVANTNYTLSNVKYNGSITAGSKYISFSKADHTQIGPKKRLRIFIGQNYNSGEELPLNFLEKLYVKYRLNKFEKEMLEAKKQKVYDKARELFKPAYTENFNQKANDLING